MSSPNIVLLLTDQHRFDHVGWMPDAPVRTPVLDGLAGGGTVFTNTYSAATNCAPARGSLLTGLAPQQYPGHEAGLKTEGRSLKPGFWTVAHQLRAAGYRTGYSGKGHFRPIHANHGFDVMRMAEHIRSYRRDGGVDPVDDYLRWLLWQGRADHTTTHLHEAGSAAGLRHDERWTAESFGAPAAFHPTAWVTDQAIDFVEAESDDRPFLLVVSYPHPHPPLDPPEPYDTMYDPAEIELPARYEPEPGALTDWWADQLGRVGRQVPGNEATARRAIAHYRGLITQIDDAIGRLLEHLDLRDTVVCFTADHGDYVGHKNRMFKNPLIPFEDLARVPMCWAGAGIGTARCAAPVQSSDFAMTTLDLAGVDRPTFTETWPSLAGVLRGEPADVDRTVFSFDRSGVNLAARRGPLKYIRGFVGDAEVLYDLETHPAETVSCIDDPAHAVALDELRAAADAYTATGIPDLPYFDR